MNTVASLPANVAALQELLVGVEMDAAHDPSGQAKIAALNAAIATLASPAVECELPEPALVFHTIDHACHFADGVELVGDTANFYSEAQMQSALATAEQPGSAVQGEKCCGYCCPACGRCYTCHRRALGCLADSLTTPPPAPAAEQEK